MPGTELAYGAAFAQRPGQGAPPLSAYLPYLPTRLLCHVSTELAYIALRACYATPGTDLPYAPTRRCPSTDLGLSSYALPTQRPVLT
eukprot:3781990-Rhodomonas_salina.1